MSLSKTKILLFFVALVILAWFLYPNKIFLAYMYEGAKDLAKAEAFYKDYLAENPRDKFASLRLAQLYNKMAEPERATPILKALYEERKRDWETAETYLTHLEDMNDLENLFTARKEVAKNFMTVPHFPVERILFLLESSMHYALWMQKYDEAYAIIDELMSIAENPIYYIEAREKIDRGLKKLDNVRASLEERLKKKPMDISIRRDLINLYIALKNLDVAEALANETLDLFPNDMYVLQSRVFTKIKQKDRRGAISDLVKLLTHDELSPQDRDLYTSDLGQLYRETGDYTKASEIFTTQRDDAPLKREFWMNILGVHLEAKAWDKASELLELYLLKFPKDHEQRKLLVDIHLYEMQDGNALDLYEDYLEGNGDIGLALDVAALLAKKIPSEEESWLEKCLELFGDNEKITGALVASYLDHKDYVSAAALLESHLKAHPKQANFLLTLAQIKTLTGEAEAAESLYDKLLTLKLDFETQRLVGRELFFLGFADKAKRVLNEASSLNPNDVETLFWLSEIDFFQGYKNGAREKAHLVVTILSERQKRSVEENRMLLKARSRLGFTPELDHDYQIALQNAPRDADLHSDFIDAQLEYKKLWGAQQALRSYREKFPTDKERLRPFEIRIAFLNKDWGTAARLLRQMLVEKPGEWSWRRDLADAYVNAGRWREGVKEYDAVCAATGNQLKVQRRLNELHDEYDYKIKGGYRFTSLGVEDIHEGVAGFDAYLNKSWEWNSEFKIGDYNSPSANFRNLASTGEGVFFFHGLKQTTLKMGLGFGASEIRQTMTPVLGASFEPFENLKFELDSAWRKLRTDVPQAVANGALVDEIKFGTRLGLWERVELASRYEFTRSYLPQGQKSIGHRLEPSLSFIVLKEPYLSFGYQYSFLDQSDEGGFLGRISLIPRMSAHYLTGYMNKNFGEKMTVEVNAFIGEDSARDLKIFEGDLFGFGSKLGWRVTRHLKFDAEYEFGRETSTNVAGEFHQFGFFMTGHWF